MRFLNNIILQKISNFFHNSKKNSLISVPLENFFEETTLLNSFPSFTILRDHIFTKWFKNFRKEFYILILCLKKIPYEYKFHQKVVYAEVFN